MFKKVIVGISGGVDSAVSALLLKQRGFDVRAAFMQNWDIADETGFCMSEADFSDACEACDILKIPITHVNFVKEYWNEVFTYLLKEYQTGFTPNPDIVCNQCIKFNHFYNYAIDHLNADAIATGHYARTSFGLFLENYQQDKPAKLLRAHDTSKDQTLFLAQITEKVLRRTMFPLGDLTKTEVKRIAVDNGLKKFALKKESMGICFIGTRRFQQFISEYIENKPGDFVDVDSGKVVGKHNGIHQWTLGQRSKLSGYSEALFTAVKDVNKNIIYVAQGTNHPALHSTLIFTSEPHWISSQPEDLQSGNILECDFKFQHIETLTKCRVCQTKKGLIIKIAHDKRALTPGQYAVLYKDGECLGSAKITYSPSNFTINYLKNKANSALHSEIIEKFEEIDHCSTDNECVESR